MSATLARCVARAVVAGLAAKVVADQLPVGGRLGAALGVAFGGTAGVGAYLAVQWALRAPELALRALRGRGDVLHDGRTPAPIRGARSVPERPGATAVVPEDEVPVTA